MQGIKIRNILGILLGTAIFSFGFVHFNMQNELGEGGFSGIRMLSMCMSGTYDKNFRQMSFTLYVVSVMY